MELSRPSRHFNETDVKKKTRVRKYVSFREMADVIYVFLVRQRRQLDAYYACLSFSL